MPGLSPGTDGPDSYSLCLGSRAAHHYSMRSPTSNPLPLPSACFPKRTVKSCLLKKNRRRSTRRAHSRPLRRPPLSTAAAPSKPIGTQQGTPFFYSHLTQHATFLIACGFNTHSTAVGPRFSTTDF